jgi:hypothetical protein
MHMTAKASQKKEFSKTMLSTPLSQYSQTKKTLTPPLATLNMHSSSWISERLPEMLWAALIRHYHVGDDGYVIFRDIIRWLSENKSNTELVGVTHTDIKNYPDPLRKSFIAHIVEQAGSVALRPLLLLPDLPAYEDWKASINEVEQDENMDWSQLTKAISITLWHQSQEATDLRWVKLTGALLDGRVKFPQSMVGRVEEINSYPKSGDQREVRPSIRSLEIMENLQSPEYQWAAKFWEFVYKHTACMPEVDERDIAMFEAKYALVSDNKAYYMKITRRIRQKLVDHYFTTSVTSAIDARHEAVFGLALYSLDIFIENNIFLSASTPIGRVTARIMLESYLSMAYLIKKESEGEQLWEAFRNYGTGQVSLIERKYEDEGYQSSMVNLEVMDKIANEDKWSEFVPIYLGHWDTSDLRRMSIDVNEKALYDKYYPYTSGYVHATWGAVREASLQTCMNPLHRLHRIPSYGLTILPNINEDCREILNKMFSLVDQAYPGFNERMRKPVERKAKK